MLLLVLLLAPRMACVEVAGDRITAGDLAPAVAAFRNLDPSIPLGYSPMLGAVRRLSRKTLAAALGSAAALAELPPEVCVVRKAVPLREEALLAAMRKGLPPEATVAILRGPSAPVPEGEPVFHPAGIRPTGLPGVYSWCGRVRPAGGGRSVPISAVVRIRIERRVLVAKHSLPAGTIVAEGDLAAELRDPGWPPPAPAEEPTHYAGWKTRRRIEAGEVVDPRWLAAPLAAKPGSPIALSVEQPGARLRVEALALTAGRTGDTILVRSPFAAARVRARLTGPGEAVLAGEAIGR